MILKDDRCSVRFEPASLQISIQETGQRWVPVSVAQTNLGPVANLAASATNAGWSFPDEKISVAIAVDGKGMRAHIQSENSGSFTFPIIPGNDSAKAWILPLFEGVYAPCGDVQWTSFLTRSGAMNTTADLTMPFVGLDYGDLTLTYIFTNPFNNKLEFQPSPDKKLEARFTHQFTANHAVKEYGVIILPGKKSPVEPARLYRDWLMQRGELVSFKEKIRQTPEAAKLLGAAHIYLWGGECIHLGDVKNWKQFCQALKGQGEGPGKSAAKRIWSLMTPEAKSFVGRLLMEDWPDHYTERQITAELDRLLRLPDLLGGQSKSGGAVKIPAEICRANCRWLADAFPGLLAEPDTWGDGVSPKMIHQLAAAGFDRLWLGSDSWDGFVNRPETVAAAKKAGFLIGPYDSFNSIHSPDEPDTWETAQFDPALYETGAIVNADGSKRRGFKKKGFVLSPDAARPYVEKRVSDLMNVFHANSWFIDCDGFGDYFDDFSTRHPATQETDMLARISRMKWIRDTFGAVIGTEGCSAGVASTVHFAHGVMTPVIGWGDPDLTDPKSKYYTGGYYPPDAPKAFFMPVPIKEEYRYIYFEPRFRLPLFQTVFHDSVIATHHWSCGSLKSKDLAKTVELLELLYNVPPLYHLSIEEFQTRKQQIQRHYEFFSPLHRQLAESPMTDFQWLKPDHSVQMTTFGDTIDLVANFGRSDFQFQKLTVPFGSILAKWRDGQKPLLFTP